MHTHLAFLFAQPKTGRIAFLTYAGILIMPMKKRAAFQLLVSMLHGTHTHAHEQVCMGTSSLIIRLYPVGLVLWHSNAPNSEYD